MACTKTLKQIAEILDVNSEALIINENILNSSYHWDDIVKVSSQHLVLPTLYYRLKKHYLLDVIPADLKIYLKEIASINTNRNLKILEEVKIISDIFNNHQITHSFLKGTALITGNYFENIGERMIGDIDILVDANQIEFANQLLIDKNYIPAEQTFGAKYFEHKHLPRLRHHQKLAAVELHKNLLTQSIKNYLNPSDILFKKRVVNHINIPNAHTLLYHNALNYQINDKGDAYINFSFRSAYDCIVILNRHQDIKIDQLNLPPTVKLYYSIIGVYFNSFPKIDPSIRSRIKTRIHYFKMRSTVFYTIWNNITKYMLLSKIIFNRSLKFILNSNYRKDVLNDRSRIINDLRK